MMKGKQETEKHDNFKNDKIVFVMAIAGRFTTFQRFLNNYEEVSLQSLAFPIRCSIAYTTVSI